ncbi:TetR/AcrR family transcriptional regulator [Mumia sp. DW29H23]|uniref:TetR/AcrR family transcriptional regulator n=1 Tax=Mumia sp. DW29H23 TaxID=3421241 RepID=UPI003D69AA1B
MAARAPRQSRSAARLDTLREAAGSLLIDEGPDAITFRGVAKAAGLPAGTASYYFDSRDQLYAAAVEAAEHQRTTAAQDRADALEPRFREAPEVARLLIEVAYAPHVADDVVALRLEPMLAAQRSSDLRDTMAASRPRLLRALATVITRSEHPEPSTDDLDLLAQVVDAALLYARGRGSDHVLDDASRTVARMLTLLDREREGTASQHRPEGDADEPQGDAAPQDAAPQ